MDVENRKYALEKAIQISLNAPENIMKLAQDIQDFLLPPPMLKIEETQAEYGAPAFTTVSRTLGNRISNGLPELTKMEKVALNKAIELYQKGEKCGGAYIAKALQPPISQSHASLLLLSLVKKGYIARPAVQTYVPVHNQSGAAIDIPVRRMPPGYARGYKPLTYRPAENSILRKIANNANIETPSEAETASA